MAAQFDTSEVDALIRDLVDKVGPRQTLDEARGIINKGALNVRNGWRRRWSGHPHFPALPRAVTYDLREFGYNLDAEIGPDKSRPQGALGNVIEFGTSKNVPIPGGLPALADEEPKLVKAVEKAAEKLLPS